MFRFAVDKDMAAQLFNDAVDHGQPQARALSPLLGGEERVKDLFLNFPAHAQACVAYGKHHIPARNYIRMGLGVFRIQLPVFRLNDQTSAIGHGIPGVDRHVEKHLFHLPRINEHGVVFG